MVKWSADYGAKTDPFGLAHTLSPFCLGVFDGLKIAYSGVLWSTMGSYD